MISTEKLIRSSTLLLNVRLCFYSAAFVHLATAAVVLLSIDLSKNDDPELKNYERLKWRFITAWFNLINLGYFPLCLYCDWKEKQSDEDVKNVMILRKIRDTLLTSVLFPTILFADILFWFLYIYDISLITPPKLFDCAPLWSQHSLHTVSLVVVILDVILVPGRKPKSLRKRLVVMITFFAIYSLVMYYSCLNGDYVYRILQTSNEIQAMLLAASFIAYLIIFNLQWHIIDFVWGKREDIEKLK